MRALCPTCGLYHDVVRILEDGHGDLRRDVYQVAELEECEREWISESELLEAQAKWGHDPTVQDESDVA
jgi:hypothetical protein